jgi:NDP-sugar pyrophosphorylase family protein
VIYVNGQSLGGRGSAGAGAVAAEYKGIPLKVTPGSPGGMWTINMQGASVSLNEGPFESQINGLRFQIKNNELHINGEKVSLDGSPSIPREDSAELKRLRATYPGVNFVGDPPSGAVGRDVTIEKGATVDFSGDLKLSGKTHIAAGASVGGSVRIRDSKIEENASVRGNAQITGSTLGKGAHVRGNAEVRNSVLEPGAEIRGNAEVTDSVLKPGSEVRGNVQITNSTLEPGEEIRGNREIFRGNGRGTAPARKEDAFEDDDAVSLRGHAIVVGNGVRVTGGTVTVAGQVVSGGIVTGAKFDSIG